MVRDAVTLQVRLGMAAQQAVGAHMLTAFLKPQI